MKRILAHRIIYEGETYRMSIAVIDEITGTVRIEPFVNETYSTIFVSGTIKITRDRKSITIDSIT